MFDRTAAANARRALGMTQVALAEALCAAGFPTSAATVAAWEQGSRAPRPHMIEPLARLLQVTPEYLGRARIDDPLIAQIAEMSADEQELIATPATREILRARGQWKGA